MRAKPLVLVLVLLVAGAMFAGSVAATGPMTMQASHAQNMNSQQGHQAGNQNQVGDQNAPDHGNNGEHTGESGSNNGGR